MGTSPFVDVKIAQSAIVYPTRRKHIRRLVKFGLSCDIRIVVRSGGHSFGGTSSCNPDEGDGECIQIDMAHFNHLDMVKDGQGKVTSIVTGASVRLGDLYEALAEEGLPPPLSSFFLRT